MCNFSTGFIAGMAMGVGFVLAVHPMNKRSARRAYHRAERMMNKMNNKIRDWV